MKKVSATLFCLLFSSVLFSQITIVGYGGPEALVAGFSLEDVPDTHSSNLGAFAGAKLGMILDEQFEVGVYGLGKVNQLTRNYDGTQGGSPGDKNIRYYQGGVSFAYLGALSERIQLFPALRAGIGRITIEDKIYQDWVGLFSPEAGIQVKLTDFMMVALSGGYQLAVLVNEGPYENSSFSAPFGAISLKFGSFGKEVIMNQE